MRKQRKSGKRMWALCVISCLLLGGLYIAPVEQVKAAQDDDYVYICGHEWRSYTWHGIKCL